MVSSLSPPPLPLTALHILTLFALTLVLYEDVFLLYPKAFSVQMSPMKT